MKFRRLQADELAELEKDFIQFLSANTVTGDDWVKMKTESPEKAEGLIEVFSDIVFEKVLKKVEYLEFKTQKDIKTFHCLPEKIIMLGMMVDGETPLDFTQDIPPAEMMKTLNASEAGVKLYRAEKAYKGERELEIFGMMENGCLISKGELFNTMKSLVQE